MSVTCSTATTNGTVGPSLPQRSNSKAQAKEEYYALISQEDSDAQYGEEEEEFEESSPSQSDEQASSSSNEACSENQEYEDVDMPRNHRV